MSGATEGDPDLELVEGLAGGDESALDGLMDRYQEPVFHFIYRHVFNEDDARDLTQEVFVRLFFNVRKFKPEAKFSTWLYQIALNLCRDRAKSRKTRQAARTDSLSAREDDREHPACDLAVEARTPLDEALAREKLIALDDGMAALPHDLRTALVLTTLEQRSHQECATLMKTTPKAIETRVYRARKFLTEWMSKAGFAVLLAGLFR
ncbi:MAG: RNA polymerase sigma factor [Chthoniobacteraceae bacterium]